MHNGRTPIAALRMTDESTPERSCDVIVIGGGPAGSTIAALLAEKGWDVAVLERDRHPRFHIGESLLPHNNKLFERLGVLDEVRRVGVVKNGAEFNSPDHAEPRTFYFDEAMDQSVQSAFQVHRADLDLILIRNAVRKGAAVFESTQAVEVTLPEAGAQVLARGPDGDCRWRARFLVDASGRDTVLANLFRIKRANRKHSSAALYAHYEGAQHRAGRDAGNITIYWFKHGWFWFIPLARGVSSVGAVCWPYYLKSRRGSLDQFFDETTALCTALAERLRDARRITPVIATGNYSYQSVRSHGPNCLMIGDAFAFVDPVFSSGVYLAMAGAFSGADAVDACLRDPAAAPRVVRAYERRVRSGLRLFSWFIYRVTTPVMRDLLMRPRNILGVVRGVVSLLAGDIYGARGVRWRIRVFQLIYYLKSAAAPGQSTAAARRRRANIRPVA
jgi:flavin-dependent dehydrogenase